MFKIMLLSFLVLSACNAGDGTKAVLHKPSCMNGIYIGKLPNGDSFFCIRTGGVKIPYSDANVKAEDRRNIALSDLEKKCIEDAVTNCFGVKFEFSKNFLNLQLNLYKPVEFGK